MLENPCRKRFLSLFVVETDKVTLEIVAEVSGVLNIRVSEGETVAIGTVVGTIQTKVTPAYPSKPAPPKEEEAMPRVPPEKTEEPAPVELSAEKASIEPELKSIYRTGTVRSTANHSAVGPPVDC